MPSGWMLATVSLQVYTTPAVKLMPSGWTLATVSLQVYNTSS